MMTATLSSSRPAARSAPRLPDDRSNPSTYELRTSRTHPSADPTCPLIAARAMRSARPARTSLPFRFRNSSSQRRDLTASARRCLPSQVITLTLFIPFYPLSCDSAKPSGPSLSRPATPATRHSPPATNLDSISPRFYFTAPCNPFSVNAFHNISDKVKFLSHHARPTLPSRVARAAHTEDPVGLPSTAAPISARAALASPEGELFCHVSTQARNCSC
jgi:hypothetical protein